MKQETTLQEPKGHDYGVFLIVLLFRRLSCRLRFGVQILSSPRCCLFWK